MQDHLRDPDKLEYTEAAMSTPFSPRELINRATEDRARQIFEEFDDLTVPMQEQARLLTRIGLGHQLNDETFRDLLAVMLHFWRDCNQARFLATKDSRNDIKEMITSVQIDQFLNGAMLSLNGIPVQLEGDYMIAEPDGS